jgi:hypothetical protein
MAQLMERYLAAFFIACHLRSNSSGQGSKMQ